MSSVNLYKMERGIIFKQTVFSLSEEGKTANTRSNAFIVVIMPSDRAAKISRFDAFVLL